MKPKDLSFPFVWNERRPLFSRGVLFVPKYYEHHNQWDTTEWLSIIASYPSVNVEFGAGNGDWIAEKAKKAQETLWIAVEKRFDRVRKIWSKQNNFSLSNLVVVCGAAEVFSAHYLPSICIDNIFINFPDPWPKAKHAKHRLLQRSFVHEMHRIAKAEGEVTIVTDDIPYSAQVLEQMQVGNWKSKIASPGYTTEWFDYGESFFALLWKQKGKEIRYMPFNKKGDSA
ncbi:MAG: tRNA (guanosine(46)-N7)-methyltransferase TrmB [Chlamydiae bacterium]|nr:tRNA (guanosine(46)-N7)-methyltransferase TrmB [Chlamydiota bacterium]